jgi:arylsulfatase A-like enzyme
MMTLSEFKPHAAILRLAAVAVLTLALGSIGDAQQTTGTPGAPGTTTTIKGNQLPAPPEKFGGVIKPSAKDSTPWWPSRIVPPKGAPNVLLIMTDDQGYGVAGTFGGVIPTPALDRIATNGLRYIQFHSTALCSPTRAALITGRNHHSVGSGVIGELSTGYPGYDSIIGPENATIGTILRDNGYATSWFGKNHNTPNFQYSVAGPYDQWPSGMGFEYFYGFMGGETDQWTPYLFRDHTQITPYVGRTDYNLTTDLADEAIKHLRDLNAAAPDKPFFLYYVPGGTHSPHQPTKEWIEKYKGKFDMGYEKLRDEIFANQKRLGVVPASAQLTPWPDSIPRWDSLSVLEKKLYAHQAEVFAAYAAYTDFEIGRVIQEVQDQGKLDNTLIIYIDGDNGTSPEGTLSGAFNQLTAYNGILKAPEALQLAHMDQWGSDKTYPHMSVGWSWAFDTPFKWTKQVASHFGGTRQGLAISWPGHITDPGAIRTQFHHVIDIVPTILEAAGIPAPTTVNGITQRPIEGVSMVYTFTKANADAPSTRTTQYFEMAGNRAIYHDGWIAATTPFAPPWDLATGTLPDVTTGYKWELYNIAEDFTENNDLSAKMPDKLKELQALFQTEATKYNVFPLDNTAFSRLLTPRPSAVAGRTVFTYTGVNSGIPLGNAPSILDKDYKITAEITVPDGGGEGMIATLGGRFGGYALFLSKSDNWWLRSPVVKAIVWGLFILGLLIVLIGRRNNPGWGTRIGYLFLLIAPLWLLAGALTGVVNIGRGRPVFVYNLLDLERFRWSGPSLSSGKHTIVFDFKYDGPGPGKGGEGVLYEDGKEVDRKKLEHTIPLMMTIDETFDIGLDTRTAVDYSYDPPFAFNGKIDKLTYNLGPEQLSADDKADAEKKLAAAKD